MKESEIVSEVKMQFKEMYKKRFKKVGGAFIINPYKIKMLSNSSRNYSEHLSFSNNQLNPLVTSGCLICQWKSYYPCDDFFEEIERESLIEMNIPLSQPIELKIKKEEEFINDYSRKIDKAKARRNVLKQKLEEVAK